MKQYVPHHERRPNPRRLGRARLIKELEFERVLADHGWLNYEGYKGMLRRCERERDDLRRQLAAHEPTDHTLELSA